SQLLPLTAIPAAAALHPDLRTLQVRITTDRRPSGIRPIQCGEVATRVAIGAACRKHNADIRAAFPDIQLGLGVKGGCEIAFHDVMLGLDSDLAVADLDWENAFGLRSSNQCYKSLAASPTLAHFLRPFHALYRFPAPVFVGDGKGKIIFRHACTTGPRQGCIMGSMGFGASVKSLYSDTRALKPAVEHMINHAPDGGGRVRRDKS